MGKCWENVEVLGECWERFGKILGQAQMRKFGGSGVIRQNRQFRRVSMWVIPGLRFPEKSDVQNEKKPMPDRISKKCGGFSGIIRPILAFQKLPYTLFRFSARQAKFGKSGFRAV